MAIDDVEVINAATGERTTRAFTAEEISQRAAEKIARATATLDKDVDAFQEEYLKSFVVEYGEGEDIVTSNCSERSANALSGYLFMHLNDPDDDFLVHWTQDDVQIDIGIDVVQGLQKLVMSVRNKSFSVANAIKAGGYVEGWQTTFVTNMEA